VLCWTCCWLMGSCPCRQEWLRLRNVCPTLASCSLHGAAAVLGLLVTAVLIWSCHARHGVVWGDDDNFIPRTEICRDFLGLKDSIYP
jgi:hypothetical protein